MSYPREVSPELITPEYWNGVDIADTSIFELQPGEVPAQLVEPPYGSRRFTAKALVNTLDQVLDNQYRERTLDTPTEFNPSAAGTDLVDGSVVIIDRESLIASRSVYPQVRVIIPTPRIEAPYAEYWFENRTEDKGGIRPPMSRTIGREFAFFDGALGPEEPRLEYTRSIRWGVILSDANDNRIVRILPLYAAHSLGSIARLSADHRKLEKWESLPQPVHETVIDKTVAGGRLSVRGMHRNQSITLIEPYPPEPRNRRRTPVEVLKEVFPSIAEVIAPKPTWAPIPVPVR